MQTVYAWADTTWCYEDELHQYDWKSDDCFTLEFPDELDEEVIEVYVCRVVGKWSEFLQTWV